MSVIGKGVIGTCIKYDLRYGCGKSVESVREIKNAKTTKNWCSIIGRTIKTFFQALPLTLFWSIFLTFITWRIYPRTTSKRVPL